MTKNFTKSIIFYLLICLAFLTLVLSVFYKKQHQSFNFLFRTSVLKKTLKKFKSIDVFLQKKEYLVFQSELLGLLFFYVSEKFSIKRVGLNLSHIKVVLERNNIPKELIAEYLNLIEYLERCKYSPHRGDKINKDLYARSFKLIHKIDALI